MKAHKFGKSNNTWIDKQVRLKASSMIQAGLIYY